MTQVVSKVGIHCVGDKRTGYGPFLQTINAAGRRLSVVKCRDNFGAIDEPLKLWPDVLTIGAMTEWDDADYNVQTAYYSITAAAQANPGVKYWEYFNERNGDYKQQADFYIALLPMLRAVGVRLCLFNCASGTPEYSTIDPVPYREIARACKFAVDGGYDALLGLHEYESAGGTIGRYKVLADYLEDAHALIPIAITEYGFETWPKSTVHMAMLKQNDPLYMADKRVIGCADWTLGGGGWSGSNYQDDLPAMAQYIATVEPDEPDPDPIQYVESYSGEMAAQVVLVDAAHNIWELESSPNDRNPDAGRPVLKNGLPHAGGYAEALLYWQGAIYATNARAEWYRATDTGWVSVAGDPRKLVVPPPVSTPFWCAYPVGGIESPNITDHFNAPRTYANKKHEGTDFDAYQNAIGKNAPILAAQDGIVEYVNTHSGTSYGLHIVIRHPWDGDDDRYRTLYSHLSRADVKAGQIVTRGQPIGVSGATGTTAIHLHFGVYDAIAGLKDYYRCDDCGAKWPEGVIDPESVLRLPVLPPVSSTAWRGLHMRADGSNEGADFACLHIAKLNAAKLMTNTSFDDLHRLITEGIAPDHIVLRLFAAGDNPALKSAATFFDEQRAWLTEFNARGGRYVEVHNEPNLKDEGMFTAWKTPAEFASWFNAVAFLIRSAFPNLLIGWPGMSPKSDPDPLSRWIPDADFYPAMQASIALRRVDWIGDHCYWGNLAQMNDNGNGRHYRRLLNYGRPVIITEFSNNIDGDDDTTKGRQYKNYYASLEAGVLGAFAFVSSASNPAFSTTRETWARGGNVTEIPIEVGA